MIEYIAKTNNFFYSFSTISSPCGKSLTLPNLNKNTPLSVYVKYEETRNFGLSKTDLNFWFHCPRVSLERPSVRSYGKNGNIKHNNTTGYGGVFLKQLFCSLNIKLKYDFIDRWQVLYFFFPFLLVYSFSNNLCDICDIKYANCYGCLNTLLSGKKGVIPKIYSTTFLPPPLS